MSDDLVTVATFETPSEAAGPQHILLAAGIETFLTDEPAFSTLDHDSDSGPIKLQVRQAVAGAALALLDRSRIVHDWGPASQSSDDEQPPNSRSQAAHRAFLAAILGVLFAPIELYATWLLVKILFSSEDLQGRARRWTVLAVAVNFSFYLFLVMLLSYSPPPVNPLLFSHPQEMAGIWQSPDGAMEMDIRRAGEIRFRSAELAFSGTWGVKQHEFLFYVQRLEKGPAWISQGQTFTWYLKSLDVDELVFRRPEGLQPFARKRDRK